MYINVAQRFGNYSYRDSLTTSKTSVGERESKRSPAVLDEVVDTAHEALSAGGLGRGQQLTGGGTDQ